MVKSEQKIQNEKVKNYTTHFNNRSISQLPGKKERTRMGQR